jgi:hypothetical protein
MLDDAPKQRCPSCRIRLSSQTEYDSTPSSIIDRGERVSPDFLPSSIAGKNLSHTISTTPCISSHLHTQLTQTVRRAMPAVKKVSLASSSGIDRPLRQARKASSKYRLASARVLSHSADWDLFCRLCLTRTLDRFPK